MPTLKKGGKALEKKTGFTVKVAILWPNEQVTILTERGDYRTVHRSDLEALEEESKK
jgi:hypothetical protein